MDILGNYFLDFEENEVALENIKTPSEFLNMVCGGLPMGKITTFYGSTGSGKSTFCYQTIGMAMQKDPDVFAIILDCESSVIPKRLKFVFGMDLSRVRVIRSTTVEDCCEACIALINNLWKATNSKITKQDLEKMDEKELAEILEGIKKGLSKTYSLKSNEYILKTKPQMINELLLNGYAKINKRKLPKFLIIWDTVASATVRETEKKMEENNDVNMKDPLTKALRLKTYLSTVVAKMGNLPIALFIINQISNTGFLSFKGVQETMSGGNALFHLSDIIIHMKVDSKTINEKTGLGEYTYTKFKLEKTRQSCRFNNVSLCISEILGGKIVNSEREIFELAKSLKIIDGSTRYSIMDITGTYPITEKMFMRKYEENLEYWAPILREKCVAFLRKTYFFVNELYIETGQNDYGNPDTVDKKLFNWEKSQEKKEATEDLETNE